jgi:hypothetical protein
LNRGLVPTGNLQSHCVSFAVLCRLPGTLIEFSRPRAAAGNIEYGSI